MFSRYQQVSLIKNNSGRWTSPGNSRRSPTRGRSRSRSRSIEASGLAARFHCHQEQQWMTPPFYRIFWFLHNISLVATPISYFMMRASLYQGWLTYEEHMTQSVPSGASTQERMVRDAPGRKLGGDVVMIMMLLIVSIIIYYYMNTFITLHQCTFNLLLPFFLHCVSKNIPDVFSYNSRKHCRIFIIFGRNITEKVGNQKMLYFCHLT